MSLNHALCDTLQADAGVQFVAPETLRRDFLQVFDALLRRAQKTGKVRSGLDVADVLDLVVGCATAERLARRRNAPHRPLGVVLDGLRAQPEQPVGQPLRHRRP